MTNKQYANNSRVALYELKERLGQANIDKITFFEYFFKIQTLVDDFEAFTKVKDKDILRQLKLELMTRQYELTVEVNRIINNK